MVTDDEIEQFVESTDKELHELKEEVSKLRNRIQDMLAFLITMLREFKRRLDVTADIRLARLQQHRGN
jgi:uncharacterized protein YlxW (UPF0749 family)